MQALTPTSAILSRHRLTSLSTRTASSLFLCRSAPRLRSRSPPLKEGIQAARRSHGPSIPRYPVSANHLRSFSTSVPATKDPSGLSVTSSDGVVGTPIDFDIAARIEGNESQIVSIDLSAGQVLRAESGSLMYMTEGIEMETSTGGGISKAFSRMMTGQNLFLTDYRYTKDDGGSGIVALGTDFPSKIVRLSIPRYGGKLVCQKGALLCASHTVDIQMEYSKNLTSGFFGGEGFILQGLTGDGEVFLKAGGTLIRRELSEGEQLRISSGCLVAFSNGVDYDVQMVKGFTNMFAGGEGLFMTTLTGPGVVWLQGQPAERMIGEISRRVPGGGGIGLAVPIGGGGGGGDGGDSGNSSPSSSGS